MASYMSIGDGTISSNGWHKLNVLRPGQEGIGGGSGGYSSDQQMLRYLKPDRNDDPDPEPNPNPEPKPDPQPDVETGTNLYIAAKCEQTALAQQNSVPVTITIGNKNSESAYSGRWLLLSIKKGMILLNDSSLQHSVYWRSVNEEDNLLRQSW